MERATPAPGGARRVVIVGGGITGLSAAHHLRRLCGEAAPGLEIRLFESSPRPGGQVRTERVEGLLLEAGADTLVAEKPAGLELCGELGLDVVRLARPGPSMHVVHGGRPLPLPDGLALVAPTRLRPLLASPLFTWRGKARMLLERFLPRGRGGGEDESLRSFVVRRFGREAFERVAEPVVGGLFTADAGRLSLAATVPRLLELERRHGSITRALRRRAADGVRSSGGFAWPREGMGRIVARLVAGSGPGEIRLAARIEGLELRAADGRWRVRPAAGAPLEADAVVLACPAFVSAELLRDHDADLARELGRLEHASCATVHLAYGREQLGRPLRGLGFFVPRTAGLSLLGCTYVNLKFPDRVPGGRVVLRAFLGGARDPGLLERSDARLAREAHDALAGLLDLRGDPDLRLVHRHPRAMPQYPVGHPGRVRAILRRLENHRGLFLAGGALGSVGVPDCTASGRRAAAAVAELLSSRWAGLGRAVGS